ncbi:hypothetical protein AB1Y20_004601 [Prymnesium parvum]|uniref:RING-type domain-containing protein n=1 Tax=Prymnesium parvum TaxID=97485 RepID=A0AB34IX75_PRYPA
MARLQIKWSRRARDPKARARLAELTFDLLTAAISLADIAADVAVALEFAHAGRTAFLAASLAIFAIAQASYAFMFVLTFAAHLSNLQQSVVFAAALPFSQLVPVFTLLEAQTTLFAGGLRRVGLRPTQLRHAGNADSLWTLLNRKLHAHAGFLLEALVEAIPQCALQIAAVVSAREMSAVALASILLSLCVIGSKGWLAAYSIHRPTFVFNSIAIAADVACLFSSAAWVSHHMWASSETAAAAWVARAYLGLFAATVVVGVAGGLAATVYSIADDHLKARDPKQDVEFDSICFNLYLIRLFTWALSVLPCATLLATLRLALLPLLVFHSLSSEHALHHPFFDGLFAFLLADPPNRAHRLKIANSLLSLAAAAAPSLEAKLRGAPTPQLPRLVGEWLSHLGTPLPPADARPVASPPLPSPTPLLLPFPSPPPPAEREVVLMRRGTLRRTLAARAFSRRVAWVRSQLLLRSEVFRRLLRASPLAPAAAAAADRLLLAVALAALALASLLAALPLLLLLVPLGATFPFIQLGLSLASPPSDEPLLPYTLTFVYMAMLVPMALLLPAVRQFHALRSELVCTRELPDAFFCAAVPLEMQRRLAVAMGIGFNTECSVCCERIEARDAATVLRRCSHAFHTDCLAQWLRENPTCPNCRQPAPPHELTMVPFPLALAPEDDSIAGES